ncbi:MAG: glycosyltransferase, partial [Rhodospirillales bacterium]|nr:glycosyltransferase [Rhodospirillales bacterium]
MTAPAASIAFVLKGYPRLSETFIAQEILSLERRGLDIRLISLRHPTDARIHPVHREIKAKVSYLPEYLYREPLRVYRAWLKVRKRPGYPAARALWLRDLPRDPTPNRIRRFGQALVLAAELPEDVTHIHAHFLHTPASVARYAARILGLGWSCSAHAKDIWTTPEWEKREKLADCQWLVTCTRLNADHLRNLAADPDKVDLVYHGLDLSRFPPPAADPSGRNGRSPTDPVRILSVGRVVEKKGYPLLLKALARLPDDLCWRFVHVGGGKGLARLRKLADRLGLGDRVSWKGALPQEEVIDQYRKADLFVL